MCLTVGHCGSRARLGLGPMGPGHYRKAAPSDGYYEEVWEVVIMPEGSRSQAGTLIGGGPGRCELRRILLLRLYEKVASAGKAPRHDSPHGSIYERLAARTELLVVIDTLPGTFSRRHFLK